MGSVAGESVRLSYPPARRDGSVVDAYHGVQIPDPYRWLEDPDSEEFVAALAESVLAGCGDSEGLRREVTSLFDHPRQLTAPKDKVQTLQRDRDILKTNLNKAEEKVKLLSEELRTLHESNKGLLISEKKHSASNSTKVHDVTTHQTLNTDTVVDIDEEHGGPLANNTNMNNNISGDQAFSKGQEPTELDPKDKGLFNFMKPISLAALGVIGPLSFASFALMGSAGYPTISKFYKDYLLISTGVFFLYSLITCGVVHAVEGRPNDIDLAFAMIIAEIAYVFFVLCLDAMIFVGAPWFIIPLSLFLWLVLTGWLVWRFRRPTGLYTLLRMLKEFLCKSNMK